MNHIALTVNAELFHPGIPNLHKLTARFNKTVVATNDAFFRHSSEEVSNGAFNSNIYRETITKLGRTNVDLNAAAIFAIRQVILVWIVSAEHKN